MNDPHVVALHYRVEHSKGITFGDNPTPVERETSAFHLLLSEGVATFRMKEHQASEDNARQLVEEFLRPWEIAQAVGPEATGLKFVFQRSEIIDRSPSAISATVSVAPIPQAKIWVLLEGYPDPPEDFRASPDVEVMWSLYEGYLQGRDRLPSMAYTFFTRLLYDAGEVKEAARRYNVSKQVLITLKRLSSYKGDETSARKWTPGQAAQPLSDQEIMWIERTLERLIYRVGQYASDPDKERPTITMAHLPQL